jgi:ComF family protein
MHRKIASITQLLRLPSICSLCSQHHLGSLAVCDACEPYFAIIGTSCRYCALPLPNSTYLVCGQCSIQKPAFDKVITAYRFEEPLRALLHEFKYEDGLYLCSFLAKLMLNAFVSEDARTQCLIPVPMHTSRLRERGFNQAVELTKLLAKAVDRPYDLNLCVKIKNSTPQARLNAKRRKQNLYGAFRTRPTTYQHVTLIDDLLTTGSTAQELARSLKKNGIARVDVWCCARVLDSNSRDFFG